MSRLTLAKIESVDDDSIAQKCGIVAGDRIVSVNGQQLRDFLDWQWLSSEQSIELKILREGAECSILLERDFSQMWGINFSQEIFDGVKQCTNNCLFCFVDQLPHDARASLRIKDDDYRLSFTQGCFVTLSNLSAKSIKRILDLRISPLRFSLHAVSPEIRKRLIGPNAMRGLANCKKLLDGGIEFYMQIVLYPGLNDQAELEKTVRWAASQNGVLGVGIVPYGYTKYQSRLKKSYENAELSLEVVEQIKKLQLEFLSQLGRAFVYLADEFYISAFGDNLCDNLPSAAHYGEFEMFEDGIGMARSTIDEWAKCVGLQQELAHALRDASFKIALVAGLAQLKLMTPLLANSSLADVFDVVYIKNNYFAGNVDVTGLLTAGDIIGSKTDLDGYNYVLIPEVIFNSDGLTLDDKNLEYRQKYFDAKLVVVPCNPAAYLQAALQLDYRKEV